MNVYIVCLVIFLTSLLAFAVTGCLTRRPTIPLDRLADPRPLPGELARAGRFDVTWQDPRFAGAADPAQRIMPLAGGIEQHIREIEWLQEQAEQAIPERWR